MCIVKRSSLSTIDRTSQPRWLSLTRVEGGWDQHLRDQHSNIRAHVDRTILPAQTQCNQLRRATESAVRGNEGQSCVTNPSPHPSVATLPPIEFPLSVCACTNEDPRSDRSTRDGGICSIEERRSNTAEPSELSASKTRPSQILCSLLAVVSLMNFPRVRVFGCSLPRQ